MIKNCNTLPQLEFLWFIKNPIDLEHKQYIFLSWRNKILNYCNDDTIDEVLSQIYFYKIECDKILNLKDKFITDYVSTNSSNYLNIMDEFISIFNDNNRQDDMKEIISILKWVTIELDMLDVTLLHNYESTVN